MDRALLVSRVTAAAAVITTATCIGTSTAAAHTTIQRPWLRALELRSEGLDRQDHLGSFHPIDAGLRLVAPGQHPDWLRALQLRGQGLDQVHHLGSFTPLVP